MCNVPEQVKKDIFALAASTDPFGPLGIEVESVENWLKSIENGGSMNKSLRELIANQCHASWAGWMTHLFVNSKKNSKGQVVIPAELVDHWEQQAQSHYIDLTETLKENYRIGADKYLALFAKFGDDPVLCGVPDEIQEWIYAAAATDIDAWREGLLTFKDGEKAQAVHDWLDNLPTAPEPVRSGTYQAAPEDRWEADNG